METIALIAIFLAACFLAYVNGANDNFKGVATLLGSRTTNYQRAIGWGTIMTFAGSVFSIFLAASLVHRFSGRGLVPDSVAASPIFLLAVALGAGITVFLATTTGFPISTTHSLIGALVGSGFVAIGRDVNFIHLGKTFFLPLLLSPLIALALGYLGYPLFRALGTRLGIRKDSCLCIGETQRVVLGPRPPYPLSISGVKTIETVLDTQENCGERYSGKVLGVSYGKALDFAHYISAGIVSFARGLNDTPKIVALLLVIDAFGIRSGMIVVALGMALGGLMSAKKVGETISNKITPLSHEQGFTANIVTSVLVVFASRFGLPVSTTHVSVGSLFGIGLITRRANVRVVSEILSAWVLTLPIAAILGGGVYWLLSVFV